MHDVLGMVGRGGRRRYYPRRAAVGARRFPVGSVRITPRFVDARGALRRGAPRFGSFRVAAISLPNPRRVNPEQTRAAPGVMITHAGIRTRKSWVVGWRRAVAVERAGSTNAGEDVCQDKSAVS